jgi:hypothetical protein
MMTREYLHAQDLMIRRLSVLNTGQRSIEK